MVAILSLMAVFAAMQNHFLVRQDELQRALHMSHLQLQQLQHENRRLTQQQQQAGADGASISASMDRLRAKAQQILAQANITCQLTPSVDNNTGRTNNDDDNDDSSRRHNWDTHSIFYNRIGKAGSSTLLSMFQSSVDKRHNVHVVEFEDRGSDEFLTRQGELELLQKVVGGGKLPLSFFHDHHHNNNQNDTNATATTLPSISNNTNVLNNNFPYQHARRTIFIFHSFFLNFTRYQLPQPIYMNLLRDPAARYASQYEFWKILPDIGPLVQHYAPTLEACLTSTRRNDDDNNNEATRVHIMGCPPLNYQTSYLCGHERDCHDPPTEASFLQAVRHVVHNYALVGTLERLGDFQEQVVAMLGHDWLSKPHGVRRWQRGLTRKVINNNPQNRHQDRSDEEWTALREANMYDVLLYEIVQQISAQRLAVCRRQRGNFEKPVVSFTL